MDKIEQNEGKAQVVKMRKELGDLDWRNRRQNLQTNGISNTAHEDITAKVNGRAKKLNVA